MKKPDTLFSLKRDCGVMNFIPKTFWEMGVFHSYQHPKKYERIYGKTELECNGEKRGDCKLTLKKWWHGNKGTPFKVISTDYTSYSIVSMHESYMNYLFT